ncbi:MAG: hypothetical protein ACYTDW_19475, partial [Planctomycetota bacterium]
IVAKFDNRSEGQLVGVDPSSPIYDFILRAARDNHESTVRVERFEQAVTNSQDVQKLGERYGANLVIWGWYNSIGAQPYVELIGERTILSEGVALQTPTPMAFYFLHDIPSYIIVIGIIIRRRVAHRSQLRYHTPSPHRWAVGRQGVPQFPVARLRMP